METIDFKFPKEVNSSSEEKKLFRDFRTAENTISSATLDDEEMPVFAEVKGMPLFASDVAKLHEISTSSSPLAEAVSNQKATPEEIIGTLSTSLLTLEYVKMKSALNTALSNAANEQEKAKINATYKEAIKSFQMAYSSIGLKGINERTMDGYSTEILKDTNAFNSVVNIYNSKLLLKQPGKPIFSASSVAVGKFETEVAKIDDNLVGVTVLPLNICKRPFVQGAFTKHFGQSFNLRVTISLPCVTKRCWGIPCGFGWCTHTYTLANLSYNVDLSVGYKLTCCGGSAWGSASANVCASLLGKQFCAGCSANIVGVAGISRTPNASNCIYGLGLRAQLKCTFAGITVLNLSVPFAHTFTGPCPPLPC